MPGEADSFRRVLCSKGCCNGCPSAGVDGDIASDPELLLLGVDWSRPRNGRSNQSAFEIKYTRSFAVSTHLQRPSQLEVARVYPAVRSPGNSMQVSSEVKWALLLSNVSFPFPSSRTKSQTFLRGANMISKFRYINFRTASGTLYSAQHTERAPHPQSFWLDSKTASDIVVKLN